jgi:hypothetical protein
MKVNEVWLMAHPQPHRRIRSIRGSDGQITWQHTQEQAVEYLQKGLFAYYLLHDARAVRLVVGRTAEGESFLKAEPDGESPDLLLQLPAASEPPPPV